MHPRMSKSAWCPGQTSSLSEGHSGISVHSEANVYTHIYIYIYICSLDLKTSSQPHREHVSQETGNPKHQTEHDI